jgi:hypothetical protein
VGLGLCFFGRFGLFGHRSVSLSTFSSIYFLLWESFSLSSSLMDSLLDSLLDSLDAFIYSLIEKSML